MVRRPFSDGPLELSNPAGFLVLHRSRIGKEGTLVFTRVDEGFRPIWTADSGLGEVKQMAPTENYVVAIGRPAVKAGEREREYRIVFIQTANGARFDEPFR
ncbi:MAG TPA: hypothetical protein DEH78_32990 [Solibacterales bacterium]|nr:hypothetical protein [Bryobacterales bacterium]